MLRTVLRYQGSTCNKWHYIREGQTIQIKDKGENNYLQNTHRKLKIEQHEPH